MKIGIFIFPGITQLDFTGPAQFLAAIPVAIPEATLDIVWKSHEPVPTDAGFSVLPTMTFAEAPQFDIIVAPGGGGQQAILDDPEYIEFVKRQGEGAQYIMGVCTGSITLGKAGLLDGYKASTHWGYVDQLKEYGAIHVNQRVVVDRNRITGGGVTAGIDIALKLITKICGEDFAKALELALEYAPEPPFNVGRPELAGEELTNSVREMFSNIKISAV